jgi:biopolymer transport protein ExbD
MDIFTILLLFLLVQSSTEEVLSASEALHLPVSTSEAYHKKAVTILLTREQIAVEGVSVGEVSEILRDPGPWIPGLEKELLFHARKTQAISRANPSVEFMGKVTIMGDREIHFAILKKVMATCSKAGYPNIALAVLQKEKT